MAWALRTIHNIADFFTFSLSFGANILLIWLILFKTTREFKIYSRVLTLSALSDAMFALLSIVGSPRIIISHNTLFLIADGFHHYLGYASATYVLALTVFVTHCVMHCTAIQFLFRYFLLCRFR
ncbi:hypothetical protein AAVH_18699 [Aphelenchoides avenae]|nr:hypothetical protein AAVH_18699 [Aphelenchus avenae]